MDHMEKPGSLMCGHYRERLNTWVRCIASASRIENRYAQKLLLSKSVEPFFITERDCPPKQGTKTSNIEEGRMCGFSLL